MGSKIGSLKIQLLVDKDCLAEAEWSVHCLTTAVYNLTEIPECLRDYYDGGCFTMDTTRLFARTEIASKSKDGEVGAVFIRLLPSNAYIDLIAALAEHAGCMPNIGKYGWPSLYINPSETKEQPVSSAAEPQMRVARVAGAGGQS